MATKIFVNLPVSNLDKSVEFYKSLGYSPNPQFSDNTAACIVISEEIYVMLLTHEKFKQFTPKTIADANKTTEVINAMSTESRSSVDHLVEKAIKAGGKEPRDPQDHGFMYLRAFNDLDGHIWEIFWMDPSGIPQS